MGNPELHPKIRHIVNVWRYDDWSSNEAFKLIPRWWQGWKLFAREDVVVPQLKSRLFEAAFCRSLILCRRDPFNVIERYFEPDTEFVYYDDGGLKGKVSEILGDFEKYQSIAEKAHNRAMANYTTHAFAERFFAGIE